MEEVKKMKISEMTTEYGIRYLDICLSKEEGENLNKGKAVVNFAPIIDNNPQEVRVVIGAGEERHVDRCTKCGKVIF